MEGTSNPRVDLGLAAQAHNDGAVPSACDGLSFTSPLLVGAPRPSDNVFGVGEDRVEAGLAIAVPQLGSVDSSVQGSAYDAVGDSKSAVIEPDEGVGTLQQQWPGLPVLPFGDPFWRCGKLLNIGEEAGTLGPAGSMVK